MKKIFSNFSYYSDALISFTWLALMLALIFVVLLTRGCMWRDDSARMAFYAKRYSGSVAFVAVEYLLKDGDSVVLCSHTEGTAFLADKEGRLLTNRHVACPWLDDKEFKREISDIKKYGGNPHIEHRIWIWFNGVPALREKWSVPGDHRLEDIYQSDNAYRSDGDPNVAIEAVFPVLEKNDVNDYAVLRISPTPEDIDPIPLYEKKRKMVALAPVMTLGFPMGTKAIAGRRAVVSATMGHVRRCFEKSIQADVSVHSGNSGGPVLNLRGRVIGIATSVCAERGLFTVSKVSDMANIIPIPGGLELLKKSQQGRTCWNGTTYPAEEQELKRLLHLSRFGNREAACDSENRMTSLTPHRLLVGAALHYGNGNLDRALERLDSLQDIYPLNADAMLLRLLLTRHQKDIVDTNDGRTLMSQKWDSDVEFYCFLTKVLTGDIPLRETPDGWDTLKERALLDLVRAFVYKDMQDYEMAEALFRKALSGFDSLTWKSEIAFLELEKVTSLSRGFPDSMNNNEGSPNSINVAHSVSRKNSDLKTADVSRTNEGADVEQLAYNLPEWRNMESVEETPLPDHAQTAFAMAGCGNLDASIRNCEQVNTRGCRQSFQRLRIRLLHSQLLSLKGERNKSLAALQKLRDSVTDKWYRDMASMLLGELTVKSLEERARKNPHYQLTLYTALGLKSEAEDNNTAAIRYYRHALDSSLEDCPEYELSRFRIIALR